MKINPESRVCPRRRLLNVFDGSDLSFKELSTLQDSASENGVQCRLFTERADLKAIERFVIQGNTIQMNDTRFVEELAQWIRTSYSEAIQTSDGMFSTTSGHPAAPSWFGKSLFRMSFNVKAETEKYRQQVDSSAGIAVFIADEETESAWANVGRCFERFALQATSMGILHSYLNQPVEVPEVRAAFADWLGIPDKRPDLVIRFGRGKLLPKSLRRSVDKVIATA